MVVNKVKMMGVDMGMCPRIVINKQGEDEGVNMGMCPRIVLKRVKMKGWT